MPHRTSPLPSDWTDVLTRCSTPEDRPSGEGWQTCREIAKARGRSISATSQRLRIAIADGLIETYDGTERTGVGCRPQRWYRRRA